MLLGLEQVQAEVIESLLEAVAQWDGKDGPLGRLPQLVLGQLRWLDSVVDGRRMAQKLLDIVGITSRTLKKDIISAIPDIVGDSEHRVVVLALQERLKEDATLMVPVLDALSALHLHVSLMADCIDGILAQLKSLRSADMPVVVRFLLLSSGSGERLNAVIEALRADMDEVLRGLASKDPRGPVNSDESLLMDAIRAGVCYHKHVRLAFLRCIDRAVEVGSLRILDAWVLFAAFANPGSRKQAEALVRRKALAGLATPALLRDAVAGHSGAHMAHFRELLALADLLLRQAAAACSRLGASLYAELFLAMPEPFQRQEVVGALCTHIGSGVASEVDAALSVLVSLADHDAGRSLRPLHAFLAGMLDYLDGLHDSSIRKIFRVFTTMAFFSGASSSSSSSADPHGRERTQAAAVARDLDIVISKQIGHSNPRFRRIGVIGTAAIVGARARRPAGSPADCPMPDLEREASVRLITQAVDSSARSPFVFGLLLDELSAAIDTGLLYRDVAAHVFEFAVQRLTDEFLFDQEPATDEEGNELEPLHLLHPWATSLPGCASGVELHSPLISFCHRVLKIASLAHKDDDGPAGPRASLAYLAPLVRCATVAGIAHTGGVAELAVLPVVGVLMPEREFLVNLTRQPREDQDWACVTLFHAANWYREVLSGFSAEAVNPGTSDEAQLLRIIHRVQDLREVEARLERALRAHPAVNLAALAGCPTIPTRVLTTQALGTAAAPAVAAADKGKDNAAAAADGDDSSNSDDEPKRPKARAAPQKKRGAASAADGPTGQQRILEEAGGAHFLAADQAAGGASVPSSSRFLRPHFRELSLRALKLLSVPLLEFEAGDESNWTETAATIEGALFCRRDGAEPGASEIPFPASAARYLLADLYAKAHFCTRALRGRLAGAARKGRPGAADLATLQNGPVDAGFSEVGLMRPEELTRRLISDGVVRGVASLCFTTWLPAETGADPERVLAGEEAQLRKDSVAAACLALRTIELLVRASEPETAGGKSLLRALLHEVAQAVSPAASAAASRHHHPREDAPELMSLADAGSACLARVLEAAPLVRSFELAGALVDHASALLDAVPSSRQHARQRRELQRVAVGYLERPWHEAVAVQGVDPKAKVERLVGFARLSVMLADDPLEALGRLTGDVCRVIQQKSARELPWLTSACAAPLYKAMFELLTENVAGAKARLAAADGGEVVTFLSCAVERFSDLVMSAKLPEAKAHHPAVLRLGRAFVDSFSRVGLPFVGQYLASDQQGLTAVLTTFQTASRVLHTLCVDGKARKDSRVMAQAPMTKKVLELFLYKVKSVFAEKKLQGAFSVRALKHKNTRGEVVSSQLAEEEEEEEEEEDGVEDGEEDGEEGEEMEGVEQEALDDDEDDMVEVDESDDDDETGDEP